MNDLLTRYDSVDIVQSSEYLDELHQVVKSGNVLLVTSKGFSSRGVTKLVVATLENANVHVLDNITPNPELNHLQEVFEQLRSHNFEHVIGIGGGSVIDAAKVLCACFSHKQHSISSLLEQDEVSNNIHFIAIPTTSGTGAEVTPFATVWQSETNKKHSLYGVRPDLAILDPQLSLSLPHDETLYPALDALSHSLESLWNRNKTETSQAYSLAAIPLVCENLNLVLAEPNNLRARSNLQKASCLAGMAIAITKTALAHAISYPLTLRFNVPHGLACSFTLGALLNSVQKHERYTVLDQSLTKSVHAMLSGLDLPSHIQQYASPRAVLAGVGTQVDPSRAKNFILDINKKYIESVLKQSLDSA